MSTVLWPAPSIKPEIEPPDTNPKVSLALPPVRLSIAAKAWPSSVPVSAFVMLQALASFSPTSLSEPVPPVSVPIVPAE